MVLRTINVLLTSFSGLGLPPTLAIPVDSTTSISDLRQQLYGRLSQIDSRIVFTTTSNKEIESSEDPVSSLLPSRYDAFLPLRLSVPLCGGKGGFGSQLRAAGGRMSSRRKNNQENGGNSSNRNLDGRRLRTVNEAKALAEYLALKPEMQKREKEVRRKRWEQVIDLAEKREEDIRNNSKGKVDGKWVEDKEEAGERAREAALTAVISGKYHDNLLGFSSGHFGASSSSCNRGNDNLEEDESNQRQIRAVAKAKITSVYSRSCFGFDEDIDALSDDEDKQSDTGGDDFTETKGKERVTE